MLQDLRATDDTPRVAEQVLDERVLARGEPELAAPSSNRPGGDVELEIGQTKRDIEELAGRRASASRRARSSSSNGLGR